MSWPGFLWLVVPEPIDYEWIFTLALQDLDFLSQGIQWDDLGVCEAAGSGSRSLVDGHADTLPQPAQGALDGSRLGDMIRIQHAPHLALGDVEVAGETAERLGSAP